MGWSANHTVCTRRQTMCRKGDVIGADIGEITTLIDTYNGRSLQCFIAAVVFILGWENKNYLYYIIGVRKPWRVIGKECARENDQRPKKNPSFFPSKNIERKVITRPVLYCFCSAVLWICTKSGLKTYKYVSVKIRLWVWRKNQHKLLNMIIINRSAVQPGWKKSFTKTSRLKNKIEMLKFQRSSFNCVRKRDHKTLTMSSMKTR